MGEEYACFCCGEDLTKDEIGINKKLIDEDIEDFRCLSCLAMELDTTVEVLEIKIEEFKEEGCILF